VRHVLCEHRGLAPVGASHDHVHCQDDLVIFIEGPQAKLRDIDNNGWLGEFMGQPTPALQRQLQLQNPLAEWNVQLADGPRIKPPVWLQPVPALEMLDAVSHRVGINIPEFDPANLSLQVTQKA
jgi:hypothetical protein